VKTTVCLVFFNQSPVYTGGWWGAAVSGVVLRPKGAAAADDAVEVVQELLLHYDVVALRVRAQVKAVIRRHKFELLSRRNALVDCQ
jgi:hypothetical protein